MDCKQEYIEAIHTLEAMSESPRAKAVFTVARKLGFDKAVVTTPDGKQHAAAMYALQLYCNADGLAGNVPEMVETFQVVSIMSAMEESGMKCFRGYGSGVLYVLRKEGINPTSAEFALFMAMAPSWQRKVELLQTNRYGACFYAGRLLTLYNTLPGANAPFKQEGAPCTLPERQATVIATIEQLGMTFVPYCIGDGNTPKFAGILKMLRHKSNFYTAVSACGYEEGSLASHTLDVIYKLVEIAKPTSEAQVGECLLAGLIHDLAEVDIIRKRDADGNAELMRLPYDPEQRVLYIIGSYLDNCLPESIAAAVDTQMEPCAEMIRYPLGLYLHIADILTTFNK